MSIENFFEGGKLARVLLDVVLWLQPFYEGVDLAEAHLALALSDLEFDVSTFVLLNVSSHTTLLNIVYYRCDRVLHEQLSKHVPQIDSLALLNASIEVIKQTVRLEFIDIVEYLLIATMLLQLLFPELEFADNHLFFFRDRLLAILEERLRH